MRRLVVTALAVGLGFGVVVLGATFTPLTVLTSLRGVTDANGAVVTYATAASGSNGPLTVLTALRGRTDSNGALNVTVSGGTITPDVVQLTAAAFASLPASPVEGMLAVVSNANTNTWGATISGTGANHVLAYYDGTNWTVAGK